MTTIPGTYNYSTSTYSEPFGDGEGAAIVTPATNFFAIADNTPSISVADGSPFAALSPGRIIATHKGGQFDQVWWDGNSLQTAPLSFTSDSNTTLRWYEDAFAPIGLGPVALPSLEPGLPNWAIDLKDDTIGQQYSTTDANGNYSFYNLIPGDTYTVSEVQQFGWTQTAPASPGTYTETPAAGQTISGLVFGNQQNQSPPPPPSPLPPPTGSPGSAVSFTSSAPDPGTATVGQPFLYDATASDADGDPLTFDLPVHPTGMTVDPKLGIVAWQPTPDQLGLDANVLLRATDPEGQVALQWFTVNVTGQDYPPIITSTPQTNSTARL